VSEREEQRAAMEAILADADPDGMYGGIAGLWRLPANHPYQPVFRRHDQRYVLAHLGLIKDRTSKATDDIALAEMLEYAKAHRSRWLELQARFVFYPAMRVWGYFRWKGAR
jgi:hypothetical protein